MPGLLWPPGLSLPAAALEGKRRKEEQKYRRQNQMEHSRVEKQVSPEGWDVQRGRQWNLHVRDRDLKNQNDNRSPHRQHMWLRAPTWKPSLSSLARHKDRSKLGFIAERLCTAKTV